MLRKFEKRALGRLTRRRLAVAGAQQNFSRTFLTPGSKFRIKLEYVPCGPCGPCGPVSRVVPTHHLPVPLTHLGNAPDSFFGIRAATAVVDDLWLAEAGLAWLWVALGGSGWRSLATRFRLRPRWRGSRMSPLRIPVMLLNASHHQLTVIPTGPRRIPCKSLRQS